MTADRTALIDRMKTVIICSSIGADNKNYALHGLTIAEGEQLLALLDAETGTGPSRFEVIDDDGRVLTRYPASLTLSYQDEGRTLKVFLKGTHPTARDKQAKGLADILGKTRQAGAESGTEPAQEPR